MRKSKLLNLPLDGLDLDSFVQSKSLDWRGAEPFVFQNPIGWATAHASSGKDILVTKSTF